MTTDELRALDAEVHAQVFGKPVRVQRAGGGAFYWTDETGLLGALSVPKYSSEIAAAWLVVEELRTRGHALLLDDLPTATPPQWFALFDLASGHDTGSVGCDTAPEAICRAALKAVRT